jgi:hypothetical protein
VGFSSTCDYLHPVREAVMSQFHRSPLGTRILQGVAVAAWITLFWYVVRVGFARRVSMRAAALLLLTVGVAGAVGGSTYYATDRLRAGGRQTIADLISLAAYTVVAFGLLALVARWL